MRAITGLALVTALVGCPVPPADNGGGGGSSSGGSSGGSSNQDRLSNRCANASFSANAAAKRVTAFLSATAEFTDAAYELQASIFDTCKSIGQSLGMTPAELSGDFQGTCQAVRDKLRSEVDALGGEVQFDVILTPPHCEVSVDAYAACAAECDVSVQPGELDVQCEGGEIIGQCSAECQGSCAVEIQGECGGRCDGHCSAGCTGTCYGTCEGTCSATNADGQCEGTCEGTCHGTCTAGCQGSCEGTCWVEGQASCQGECRGGCSVDYERPRCETDYTPPQIDADCHASCDARFQATADCQPGEVDFAMGGDTDAAAERIERLRAAFAHFRELNVLKERARRVRDAGQRLGGSLRRLRGAAQAGVDAVACVLEAATVIPAAAASVSVSIDVSVSVSASASASATSG
ncbi:MAG: hypothetical protein AAGE52_23645 [Myxococcota bacterium]